MHVDEKIDRRLVALDDRRAGGVDHAFVAEILHQKQARLPYRRRESPARGSRRVEAPDRSQRRTRRRARDARPRHRSGRHRSAALRCAPGRSSESRVSPGEDDALEGARRGVAGERRARGAAQAALVEKSADARACAAAARASFRARRSRRDDLRPRSRRKVEPVVARSVGSRSGHSTRARPPRSPRRARALKLARVAGAGRGRHARS